MLATYIGAGRAWVVLDGDDSVGYVIVDVVDDAAHIEQVSVRLDHARRVLGRVLIDHVALWARARSLGAVTLTTFADVAWNAPYYERIGFRRLADHELSAGLAAIVGHEAKLGLDPTMRVAMVRPATGPGPGPGAGPRRRSSSHLLAGRFDALDSRPRRPRSQERSDHAHAGADSERGRARRRPHHGDHVDWVNAPGWRRAFRKWAEATGELQGLWLADLYYVRSLIDQEKDPSAADLCSEYLLYLPSDGTVPSSAMADIGRLARGERIGRCVDDPLNEMSDFMVNTVHVRLVNYVFGGFSTAMAQYRANHGVTHDLDEDRLPIWR
ncbi:MAG: GNAT family N-acetyltransferase [Acidimicrobiales bacterium]